MIRFQRPRLPDAAHVEAYLSWSREQRWFSNDGPCAKELRVRLEAAMGEKVQVALLGSGTLALMVTLRALLSDAAAARPYVVVPSYTFVATAAAIAWCGRTPLFADVEPEGWHLDPEALDAVLAEQEGQVDAILACATFGTPPPAATVARWRVAAERHGVPLMIDTAAGFGATGRDGGIHGGVEAPEVFSFHATKPFAIGEGGMVATVDGALAARIRRLANFGFDEEREVVEPFGLNAKMSELHASSRSPSSTDSTGCWPHGAGGPSGCAAAWSPPASSSRRAQRVPPGSSYLCWPRT